MFTFAWPWVFILLPLYWLVKKYVAAEHQTTEPMLRIPFLDRIQTLPQSSTATLAAPTRKRFYAVAVWSFLIIAAANPQWLGTPVPITQDGRNIMLAVDLSPSMSIPDLQQNNHPTDRLTTVKNVAAGFIAKRYGDKLGLILFGSKAYLQTPLTFDRKTVGNMLDDATIGLAGERTAIGDAIGLAIKKLSTENPASRVLILLTDGGNNSGTVDPLEAADIAKENHIKIYTVGIGASKLEVRSLFGSQVVNPSADLDEPLLKNIASKTQGNYFRAEDDTALTTILEAINRLEPVNADNKTARPITSLFYWPLAAALVFLSCFIFPTLREK